MAHLNCQLDSIYVYLILQYVTMYSHVLQRLGLYCSKIYDLREEQERPQRDGQQQQRFPKLWTKKAAMIMVSVISESLNSFLSLNYIISIFHLALCHYFKRICSLVGHHTGLHYNIVNESKLNVIFSYNSYWLI